MTKRELDELLATREHFNQFKCYTKLPEGSPSWIAFWEEERRRSLEGYHLGSDYVSGYFYWYNNYNPIYLTEVTHETGDRASGDRKYGFPDYWDGLKKASDYINEAELSGEHAFWGGSRGKSKSFFIASMMNRNYFHIEGSNNFIVAADLSYLTGSDGTLSKTWQAMDFVDTNTPWAKRRQVHNTHLHRRASVKAKDSRGVEKEEGWLSDIQGITVGDDYNKMRGKRAKLIALEESGNFRNLDKLHQTLRPGMEDGNVTFGLILHCGTGGTQGASSMGFHELMKNPKAYRIKSVPNTTDPGMEGLENGFFFPANWNYKGAYDKLGVSDIKKADELIDKELEIVKKAGDPSAVIRRTAELPRTVSEMLMRISGTQFPILELKRQEAELETKPHLYKDSEFHVTFELDRETQKYVPVHDNNATPIYSFPHLDNKNMKGCFIIYEHPQLDDKGEVFYNRYVAGGDSYDFDESGTTSLGAFYIADLWTKRVVAEYVGRPPRAFDFYETCRRGLLYYNAVANFENANNGIFRYFEDKNCYHLMCDELRISKEANPENTNAKNRPKGTTPSKLLNAYARGMLAQHWLEKTGNPDKPEELRVHRFRSIAAIREAILWNIDGNFDRISALMMLILIMNDREKYVVDGSIDLQDSIANDPWLQRLLPKHLQKQQNLLSLNK